MSFIYNITFPTWMVVVIRIWFAFCHSFASTCLVKKCSFPWLTYVISGISEQMEDHHTIIHGRENKKWFYFILFHLLHCFTSKNWILTKPIFYACSMTKIWNTYRSAYKTLLVSFYSTYPCYWIHSQLLLFSCWHEGQSCGDVKQKSVCY